MGWCGPHGSGREEFQGGESCWSPVPLGDVAGQWGWAPIEDPQLSFGIRDQGLTPGLATLCVHGFGQEIGMPPSSGSASA